MTHHITTFPLFPEHIGIKALQERNFTFLLGWIPPKEKHGLNEAHNSKIPPFCEEITAKEGQTYNIIDTPFHILGLFLLF